MKCLRCNHKTEVLETRVIDAQPRWIKRRRQCRSCAYLIWTVEMPAEDVVVKEEK
jgi:transcriptional regulator NrdR family protein